MQLRSGRRLDGAKISLETLRGCRSRRADPLSNSFYVDLQLNHTVEIGFDKRLSSSDIMCRLQI